MLNESKKTLLDCMVSARRDVWVVVSMLERESAPSGRIDFKLVKKGEDGGFTVLDELIIPATIDCICNGGSLKLACADEAISAEFLFSYSFEVELLLKEDGRAKGSHRFLIELF